MNRAVWMTWLLVIISIVLFSVYDIVFTTGVNLAMLRIAREVVSPDAYMFRIKTGAEFNPEIIDAIEISYNQGSNNKLLKYHLAQLSFWSGDLDETIRILDSKQVGDRSQLLDEILLGYSLWQKGDNSRASQVWSDIPNSETLFSQWSLYAEIDQSYELMELGYRQLTVMDPDNVSVKAGYWFARCSLLLERNSNSSEIDSCIPVAFQLNSQDYRRLLSLGTALVENNKYDLAAPILEQAVRIHNDRSHWARYYLGLAYYYLEKYESAENTLRQVTQISPDFGRGYQWLARTLVKLGKLDEAKIAYKDAMSKLQDDELLLNEFQRFVTDIQERLPN